MPIVNVKTLIDAELDGRWHFSTWRKTPTQTTAAGIWFDISMSPGNPLPNYYATTPLFAKAMRQSVNGGIAHGGNVNSLGMKKYMRTFMAMTSLSTAAPLTQIICDYLMFYPFVDMSIDSEQLMFNKSDDPAADELPRYADGKGNAIMCVVVAGPLGSGNPQFFVTYTNQDGVPGKQTRVAACNTQVVNGTIVNSQGSSPAGKSGPTGPFLTLAEGDIGVRSIQSITFLTPDIGLLSLVIVQQIDNNRIRTIDAPAERRTLQDFTDMPEIRDDAYLNLVCCPAGTIASAQINGYIHTVWG